MAPSFEAGDTDGDGIPDAEDPDPNDPDIDDDRVSDGPKDPDGTGPIIAGPDQCDGSPATETTEAEDFDDFQDEDGCPEANRQVILVPGVVLNPLELLATLDPEERAERTFECLMDYIAGPADAGPNECQSPTPVEQDPQLRSIVRINRDPEGVNSDPSFRAFSYSQSGGPYTGLDTWQHLADSAQAFEQQMTNWRLDCPSCKFDIVAHSLGGVVVAYWLNNVASGANIEAVHNVLALSSPLRGFKLGQLEFCIAGIVLTEGVLEDFCPFAVNELVTPGIDKAPFLVLNNAHDPITNGCFSLGATAGNSGAWYSTEPGMGPVTLDPLANPVTCQALLKGSDLLAFESWPAALAIILAAIAPVAENHSQTLKLEGQFGSWVRRAVVNDFYDNEAPTVSCPGWAQRTGENLTRLADDVTQGSARTSDDPASVCTFVASLEGPATIRWHTLQQKLKGSADVTIDGLQDCSRGCPVDLGGPAFETRAQYAYAVGPGGHTVTITVHDPCPVIHTPIGDFRVKCLVGDVDVDGFEIDRTPP